MQKPWRFVQLLLNIFLCRNRERLSLLSEGTRIDDNEYLGSLENGTELIICTEEQMQKMLIYFELKKYLSLKNISHQLNIDYFI